MNIVRCFTQLSRAWYGAADLETEKYTEEITISLYPDTDGDEGTLGEFSITWRPLLGKQQRSTPQLQAWDDAWAALQRCSDLLAELAKLDNAYASPETVVELLLSLGFQDATKVERGKH